MKNISACSDHSEQILMSSLTVGRSQREKDFQSIQDYNIARMATMINRAVKPRMNTWTWEIEFIESKIDETTISSQDD